MPIFRSPRPSSCVQCHLASVDLKNYILPSSRQTFLSLRDSGMIDLAQPEESKILKLISMGEKDLDRGARLIHARTRQAEYDAFAAWIKACCQDAELRSAAPLSNDAIARPAKPVEIIRHARKDRVLDSFVRNVWSQRMRCFPCHTPHELDASNPKHQKPIERHAELVKQYGQRVNLFLESPNATLKAFIARSRKHSEDRLPLINTSQPQDSLLIRKPTSKLPAKNPDGTFAKPSSALPVSHMGGLKMHVDDQSYKSFLAWIQDYARVVDEAYTDVEELPSDNWHPTQQVLRLRATPAAWPVGVPVQAMVHSWDRQRSRWSSDPVAFTQGLVTPRRFVNGSLFLLGPVVAGDKSGRSSEEQTAVARPTGGEPSAHGETVHGSLPPGKYLIKLYLDRNHELQADPAALLGAPAYVGSVEIDAAWREGFPNAEIVDIGSLQNRNESEKP